MKVDQFGETLIGELVMGRSVQVTVPLAETTLENLVRTMPGAVLSQVGGSLASGTVTFAVSAPVNLDVVTVAGVAFTFKTVPVATNDLAIPGSISAAATALAAAINADLVASASVVASALVGVVTLTAREYSVAANSVTLTKTGTNITVSGATMSGGVASTKKKVTVATGTSLSLLDFAKRLVLRPKGTTGADDFTVLKAATSGALQFAYKTDSERIYNIVFKGYADASGNLFSVGDITAP